MSHRIMGGGTAQITSPTPRTSMPAEYRQKQIAPSTLPEQLATLQGENAHLQRLIERERAATDAAQKLATYQAAELEKLRDELALLKLDTQHHPEELRKLRDLVTSTNRSLTEQWERARHAEAWAVAALTRCAEVEAIAQGWECEVSALKVQLARRREVTGIIAGEVSAIAQLVREVSPAPARPALVLVDDCDDIPAASAPPTSQADADSDAAIVEIVRVEAMCGNVGYALWRVGCVREPRLRATVRDELLAAHRWQECPCCQGAGGVGYWESEECDCCDGVGYQPISGEEE